MNYKFNRHEIRKTLHNQQPNCIYCNCSLNIDERKSLNYATIEHIVPQSKQGSQNLDNLALACPTCNSLRGNKDYFIGFQFNDNNQYFTKEDLDKILQYINLNTNLKILIDFIPIFNTKSLENMNTYLVSHKKYKFIQHILSLMTQLSEKVFEQIKKFINNLIQITLSQLALVDKISGTYNISLIEVNIFDYGLVKQHYKI